ncbi:MAG: EamA family transporter [Bacteroidota bacterium]
MNDRQLIIAAFLAVYIIWGSTYLFNTWAIESIPPFLMSSVRFSTAGVLLYAWGVWRGQPRPSLRHWLNSALMGILFLTVGTGSTVWALQYIDSGVTALIIAVDPLLIMLLLWGLLNQRPRWQGILGGLIGILGTLILVGQPQFTDSPESRWGLAASGLALTAWAFASIYISRIDLPESRPRRSAMQMIVGGATLFAYSWLSGEVGTFEPAALTNKSLGAMIYLVLFGSIVAFSAFNYLLSKVSPEQVATSTYVNPVVALLLGWWLNNEVITNQSMVAGAVLLTGVFFINRGKGQAQVE